MREGDYGSGTFSRNWQELRRIKRPLPPRGVTAVTAVTHTPTHTLSRAKNGPLRGVTAKRLAGVTGVTKGL